MIFIRPGCSRSTWRASKPGLLLIEVDFNSSKKALIEEQKYSPFELGLGRLVHANKNRFIGQAALLAEQQRGSAREIVGLEIDWPEVERLYEERRFAAGSFSDCFTRRGASLERRDACRQSDFQHLVANFEKDDCPGDGEASAQQARHAASV